MCDVVIDVVLDDGVRNTAIQFRSIIVKVHKRVVDDLYTVDGGDEVKPAARVVDNIVANHQVRDRSIEHANLFTIAGPLGNADIIFLNDGAARRAPRHLHTIAVRSEGVS